MTYSERNRGQSTIERVEPELPARAPGAYELPGPRDDSTIDFSNAPIADPERIKLADFAVREWKRAQNARSIRARGERGHE